MKRLILFFTVFFLFACSSDSEEPEVMNQPDDEVMVEEEEGEVNEEENEESESLTEGLTVIGLLRNQMTGFLEAQPQQHQVRGEFSSEIIDIQSELGIPQGDRPRFKISKNGITFFNDKVNPATGFREEFPYYKSFDGTIVNDYDAFTEINALLSFGDYQGNIWGVYYDFETYNNIDDSYEYFLKIVDSNDFSEQLLSLGRFFRGGSFKISRSNGFVYLYFTPDFLDGADASFLVIDLTSIDVISKSEDLSRNRFTLINDENDNCYLFSSDLTYFFNKNSNSLQELNFNFDTVFLSNIYTSQEINSSVYNNKLYTAAPGIQPGPQVFVPAIFDLNTGELISFDFSQEITQFEQDPFEWNPVHRAITFLPMDGYFYLGVSSSGLSPEISSDGLFVVDFEGNILEKVKVPVAPTAIRR